MLDFSCNQSTLKETPRFVLNYQKDDKNKSEKKKQHKADFDALFLEISVSGFQITSIPLAQLFWKTEIHDLHTFSPI